MKDIHVSRSGNHAEVILSLDSEPHYRVAMPDAMTVSLILDGTVLPAWAAAELEGSGLNCVIEQSPLRDLQLKISLSGALPVQQMQGFWLADRHLLGLKIRRSRMIGSPVQEVMKRVVLRNVRFGRHEGINRFDRMVLDLNGRPPWELTRKGGLLTVMLPGVTSPLDHSRHDLPGVITGVRALPDSENVSLCLTTRKTITAWRCIWLSAGSRLSLDCYDPGFKVSFAEVAGLPPDFGRRHPREPAVVERSEQLPAVVAAPSSPVAEQPSIAHRQPNLVEPALEKAAASPTVADRFRFSGFVQVFGALDTHDDRDEEGDSLFRQRTRLEGKYTLAGHDGDLSLLPGRFHLLVSLDSDYLSFGSSAHTQDDYHLKLFEGYFHYENGPFEMRLGKQLVRWGKTDQLSPVDILNHQDLRLFVTTDLEERKEPDWMVRCRWFFDSFTLEGVYQPFFKASEVDYFDTDWAIFDHLKQEVEKLPGLPPPAAAYVDALYVNEKEPSRTLANGQFGARLSTTVHDWDLALSYFNGRERLPHFASFPLPVGRLSGGPPDTGELLSLLADSVPGPPEIVITYPWMQMIGAEFETTLGDFGFRGEAAYFNHQSFLTESLVSAKKPLMFYVIGVDYMGVSDWYANFQFAYERINAYDHDILYFKQHNTAINGEIRKSFYRGNLETSLRYHVSLSDNGYYLKPKLSYKGFTNLDISLGCHLFGGDDDTYLGFYDDNDQVFMEVTWDF